MSACVFDIEAPGLLYEADKIFCICLINLVSGDIYIFHDSPPGITNNPNGTIEEGITYLLSHDYLIGHNICGYDFPLIKKLYPNDHSVNSVLKLLPSRENIYDTLAASELLYPERKHHGLGSWAEKFGMEKPEIEDYKVFTDQTLVRCVEDIKINLKLFHLLRKEESLKYGATTTTSGGMKQPHETEMKIKALHGQQLLNGIRFDVLRAKSFIEDWDAEIVSLAAKIVDGAPKSIKPVSKTAPVKKLIKADGHFTKQMMDFFGSENQIAEHKVSGPFSRLKYEELNPDSSVQLKKFMLLLGWKPTEYNYVDGRRTSPKLTEDSYNTLPGELGRTIAQYNILCHRRSILLNRKGKEKGAVWACRSDGRVEAEAHTNGTPTSRYRHSGVICNLPGPDAPLGKEIKSCFVAPEGSLIIGIDLSGIEIRMMCHHCFLYPGGREFAKLVLQGDFHQANADMWEVERGIAKRALYALLYSCSPKKLAVILGKPPHEGEMWINRFWDAYQCLKLLVSDIEKTYDDKGCLVGLDGRIMMIREKRKLLNSLLQGNSAILFKNWVIQCNRWIQGNGLTGRVKQLLLYHDEQQLEYSNPGMPNRDLINGANSVGIALKREAKLAGVRMKLNVPISAEFMVGNNLSETH